MLKPNLHLPGYLRRWHLIPKNRWFNIYLHCFEGSDSDRALHNHPWWSWSILLKGELTENYKHSLWENHSLHRHIWRLRPYYRSRTWWHQIFLKDETKPAWTLFITGPKTQKWGFEYPTLHTFMPYEVFKREVGDYDS